MIMAASDNLLPVVLWQNRIEYILHRWHWGISPLLSEVDNGNRTLDFSHLYFSQRCLSSRNKIHFYLSRSISFYRRREQEPKERK
jgi:hypothetical protein